MLRKNSLPQSRQPTTKNQILRLCEQYGARDPRQMFWIVRYALLEGADPAEVFAQVARNQPRMFY